MQQFSAPHTAALIATAALAAGAVAAARRASPSGQERLAQGLAVVILTSFAVEQLTYAGRGTWSARVNLPFQLSDAVTLISVLALWRRRRGLLAELTWFWALSASLQALVTPDLDQAFPDVLFFTYFGTHAGAIVAACLLVAGMGLFPRPGAVWRAYAATAAFTAIAGIATVVTGGNYMFLRHKPSRDSLLDVMGPWPVYILSGAAIALAMFLALDWVARAMSRRAGGPARRATARA
jgi:hypothetical integral membrane protein (TIGR02206 family)